MKIIKWLSILLSISLGANLWFLWYFYERSNTSPDYSNSAHTSGSVEQTDYTNSQQQYDYPSSQNKHLVQQENGTISATARKEPSVEELKSQRDSFLKYLQELAIQQNFVLLEYEVADYLRQYPQDIEALLLEAKAYYHTQPLNTALVHYIELLSKPLSKADRLEVEKLISVNITRVIQQFSGDGAWDLLAEFLEPLVQIDPINRQYLMPLARAYGMQQQFTLMEDALAAFASDDVRANRLRENVFARLNDSSVNESPIELPADDSLNPGQKRQADVLLKQSGGHFIAQARVHNTLVNLLVDTGASTTALSDVKFNSIAKQDTEFLGLFNVNTAGGTIEAAIYKVKQFTLGQKTLRNTSVLVLPSENLNQYDGLLGMNVLSQFDLAYDASTKTMRMYKKR